MSNVKTFLYLGYAIVLHCGNIKTLRYTVKIHIIGGDQRPLLCILLNPICFHEHNM